MSDRDRTVAIKSKNLTRTVLIFGGAGFVGSNWAAHLIQNTDAKIHLFDNLSRPGVRHNLRWLQRIKTSGERLQITIGDVRNREQVERAVRSASEIYQFAAQVAVTTSIEDPRSDFEVNLGGTFNILEAARQAAHRPFILFTSTNKVYGNLANAGEGKSQEACGSSENGISESQPLDFHSPYGCSKGAADQYVRDYARIYGIPAVVFRMSCIAGPQQFGTEDQGWVAHFLFSALQGKLITIYGDGRQVRDVLHVADLMGAFEAARLNLPATAGQIFNVGGGSANAISLLQLIREIELLTKHRMRYNFAPARQGDQAIYVTDYSKLQRATSWAPKIGIRELLTGLREWWNENRNLFAEEVETQQNDLPAFEPVARIA